MDSIKNILRNGKLRAEIEDLVRDILIDLLFLDDKILFAFLDNDEQIVGKKALNNIADIQLEEAKELSGTVVMSHFSKADLTSVAAKNDATDQSAISNEIKSLNTTDNEIKIERPSNRGLFERESDFPIISDTSEDQKVKPVKETSTSDISTVVKTHKTTDKKLDVGAKKDKKINIVKKKKKEQDQCNIIEQETKFNKHLEEFLIGGEVKAEFENETTLTRKKRIKINPDILAKIETAKKRKVLEKMLPPLIKNNHRKIRNYPEGGKIIATSPTKMVTKKSNVTVYENPKMCNCLAENCNCHLSDTSSANDN